MIQRIQTLWMLLTVALACMALFMPEVYFSLHDKIQGSQSIAAGAMTVHDGAEEGSPVASIFVTCLAALATLSAAVPFAAIFFYKKRRVQARLLAVEFILLAAGAGCFGYYYYVWMACRLWTTNLNALAAVSDGCIFSLFPLLLAVAMLTNRFALRGVRRDERLVRSIDRIR